MTNSLRAMRAMRWLAIAAVFIVPGAPNAAAAAGGVTIFAAASLKNALDEQARRFEAATGHSVVIAYGGSNALARQIEAGAPADVFISADLDWMDYVEKRNLVMPGSRVDLLRNSLVLIAPASSTAALAIGPSFPLAEALGSGKLAMANPDSVPAGRYGRRALESLGLWPAVEKRVARGDNVRAALALVARGEAPFGIVYRTDALADADVRIVGTFPPNTHPAIVYPAAAIVGGRSPVARALLADLRSPAARAVWEKHGFALAQ